MVAKPDWDALVEAAGGEPLPRNRGDRLAAFASGFRRRRLTLGEVLLELESRATDKAGDRLAGTRKWVHTNRTAISRNHDDSLRGRRTLEYGWRDVTSLVLALTAVAVMFPGRRSGSAMWLPMEYGLPGAGAVLLLATALATFRRTSALWTKPVVLALFPVAAAALGTWQATAQEVLAEPLVVTGYVLLALACLLALLPPPFWRAPETDESRHPVRRTADRLADMEAELLKRLDKVLGKSSDRDQARPRVVNALGVLYDRDQISPEEAGRALERTLRT